MPIKNLSFLFCIRPEKNDKLSLSWEKNIDIGLQKQNLSKYEIWLKEFYDWKYKRLGNNIK